MRNLTSSTVLALIATLAWAASASAADTWYAAPGGSGTDCTAIAPCSAEYAVATKPAAGDLVVFAGGTYNLTSFMQTSVGGVSFEGAKSGPPTQLIGPTDAASTLFVSGGAPDVNQHISDLIITNRLGDPGGRALYLSDGSAAGAVIERVYATATGPSGVGIEAYKLSGSGPLLVRGSAGRTTGTGGVGILAQGPMIGSGSVELHNVIGAASGSGGFGISFLGWGTPPVMCGSLSGVLINSIALGPTDDHALQVQPAVGPGNCTAHVDSTNSVWRGASGSGTTTSVGDLPNLVPRFADAANGDFHPLQGSPLVDAGASDPAAGSLDLDRNPRLIGPAIDIGPYENQILPTADTAAPSITGLRLLPSAFRPKPAATPSVETAARKKRAGTTVKFNSSEAATLTFTVQRQIRGHKQGKRCSAKSKHGKRCTSYKSVNGNFGFAAVSGANSFKFSGFVKGKPLKPGSYRLVGVAKDAAGNTGPIVRASFRIVRR